jgi:hypothetical protein
MLTGALILVACHKKKPDQPSGILDGQWRWVNWEWRNGPAGGTYSPSPDSNVILSLSEPAAWKVLLNGAAIQQGSYSYSIVCGVAGCDTLLDFGPAVPQSNVHFYIGGKYWASVRNDTLGLSNADNVNPAGPDIYRFTTHP